MSGNGGAAELSSGGEGVGELFNKGGGCRVIEQSSEMLSGGCRIVKQGVGEL